MYQFRKIRACVFVLALGVCQETTIPRLVSAQFGEAKFVSFAWSGGVTSSSAVVKAQVKQDGHTVRLVVSDAADFSAPVYVAPSNPGANVLSFALRDLKPDTPYHYVLEAGGKRDTTKSGRLRTFPSGPASFQIAFGSCAQTASDHPVFDTIRSLSPLLFIHMGDFHYRNIGKNDLARFRKAYEEVLSSPTQARLFREVPIAYMWDDHDFGGNNADATASSKPAALRAYYEYVPHYPLAAECCSVPIYQSFTIGRVHFIVTDQRSERTPAKKKDNAKKTVLGAAQKEWLKGELKKGSESPLVVWVGTAPWIATAEKNKDHWGNYSTERQELADFIKANQIDNLIMLSGDAHMVALDDGTNSAGGFPVLHAASLDQYGSEKGGPYSHGTAPNVQDSNAAVYHGQFGVLAVVDDGQQVCIKFQGRRQVLRTSEVVDLLGEPWKKCFPAPANTQS